MKAARPLPLLAVAIGLALGSAVSLGLARFAYAMLLPPMRADLGWSYFTAGAMNTVNAVGYLVGALAAPACVRRWGAGPCLLAGNVATGLTIAACGLVLDDLSLYALRCLTGAVSAVAFVAGGVLAARLAGRPDRGTGTPGKSSSGLVLGIYYGGTGLGVIAASLLVPAAAARSVAHAWQAAWIELGAIGVAAALITAFVTTERRGGPAGGASPAPSTTAAPPSGDPAAASARFHWRPFLPGLAAYFLFGLGYIGYITFIVTLLREQRLSMAAVAWFYGLLGAAITVSPWLWAGLLQRRRGGEPATLLNGLLALATLLAVASASPAAVFGSGLLFGAVLLSTVASTTALVRHNLPAAAWPAGIGAFTIVFAAGQIVGPSLVGLVADHGGGLAAGLACSAATLALASAMASRQKPLPR